MKTTDDLILELMVLKEKVGGDCPVIYRDRYNNCHELKFRIGRKAKNKNIEVKTKGVTALIVSNYDSSGYLIKG